LLHSLLLIARKKNRSGHQEEWKERRKITDIKERRKENILKGEKKENGNDQGINEGIIMRRREKKNKIV
jgi:hypothetical protein